MFKRVFVAVDNSSLSEACSVAAVSLAQAFGGGVTGCHVYAARMHERRFRQMEATLPGEYLADKELERQRTIHDSLIALGLKLISDCYLDALEKRCQEAEVPFARESLEGKNWEKLVEEINASGYDLVVMGARGHGATRTDTVGSVCQRALRRTRTDTLVIKDAQAFQDGAGRGILVALDGSQESFGALQAALALGKAYNRPVEAVAAYDPHFHYAVFHSMVEVLSSEAARVFRFKEQERLHEEIIDTGLARLYQTHLEVAERVAAAQGATLETTLLAGRAADELLAYAEKTRPWLLLLGRVGVHSREEMDIGSVTEHALRFASCNLLVASRRYTPPLDLWAQSALRWTEEAELVLNRVPEGHRGALRLVVQRLAVERGHTVATASLATEATALLRPSQAELSGMREAALSVAVEALRRENATVYMCPECGHAARSARPAFCPVCRKPGEGFLAVESAELEALAQHQGGEEEEAFDGHPMRWASAALEALQAIPEPDPRRRARLRVEKEARLRRLPVITLEFTLRHLGDAHTSRPGPSKLPPESAQRGGK
jgi:nucleotide-binding universal stress UspA family protein/predicted RNA-binding Zn-ribbon protein involved in translation (DUF1610 family)